MSLCMVRKTIFTFGESFRICLAASRPLSEGMEMSRTTTSGLRSPDAYTAAEIVNLQTDFALCGAELDTCFAGARVFRNILQAFLRNPIETERNLVRN